MSSVTRGLGVLLAAWACAAMARAEPLYILTVGDTVVSECAARSPGSAAGVYLLGPDGVERPAAGCTEAASWIPLGRRLLAARQVDKVVFLPVGVAGARMADWTGRGEAQARLGAAMRMARGKSVRFDYVLWFQGASDRGGDARRYQQGLGRVLKQVRLGVTADKILVARHSGCGGQDDPALRKAQTEFARNAHLRIFPGPDADGIGSATDAGGCRLDEAGLEGLAGRWVEAIDAADRASTAIRRETLLYWF